ncbi:MAG TPA: helix-turn-helix transcriptional regulator [Clostridia bacterium]|nr:helix-turn-helix transcriptional regulator [Clostridia bacterium]
MNIKEIISEQGYTKYGLSRLSGIPYTTVSDICSGKVRIEKCSAETVYRFAKALNITMEELIESALEGGGSLEHRSAFEVFKSNVCHRVKDMGDLDFIISTLQSDDIRRLYEKQWYPESFYLLAMVDYLSRENALPLCSNYNDIRERKLERVVYPASVLAYSAATNDNRVMQESWEAAIPEFKNFNIVENEVRNVY